MNRIESQLKRLAAGCTHVDLMLVTSMVGIVTAVGVLAHATVARADRVAMTSEASSSKPVRQAVSNAAAKATTATTQTVATASTIKLCESARPANSGISVPAERGRTAKGLACF
jgi:hypothetical protein